MFSFTKLDSGRFTVYKEGAKIHNCGYISYYEGQTEPSYHTGHGTMEHLFFSELVQLMVDFEAFIGKPVTRLDRKPAAS